MTQSEKIKYYIEKIRSNPGLEEEISLKCDLNFADEKVLSNDLSSLLTGGCKKSYGLIPFAVDAAGSVYVLIDNEHIGLIGSEGCAGYIAAYIDDFINILLTCKSLCDYLDEDVISDFETFRSTYNEINEDTGKSDLIDRFLTDEGMSDDPEGIYAILKSGVTITPAFEIDPLNDDYVKTENLLHMDDEAFSILCMDR